MIQQLLLVLVFLFLHQQFSQIHFDLYNAQLRVYFNTVDAANAQTQQAVNSLNTMVWLGL